VRKWQNELCRYHKNHAYSDKKKTWNFFKKEEIQKTNVYHCIKMYKEPDDVGYKKSSGRPVTVATPKVRNKIKKIFTKHPSTLTRIAAQQVNMSQSSSNKIKLHKLGIRARTKKSGPNYQGTQKIGLKSAAKNFPRKFREKLSSRMTRLMSKWILPMQVQDIFTIHWTLLKFPMKKKEGKRTGFQKNIEYGNVCPVMGTFPILGFGWKYKPGCLPQKVHQRWFGALH
jgi:hypothetical protein